MKTDQLFFDYAQGTVSGLELVIIGFSPCWSSARSSGVVLTVKRRRR